jgi:hypothetical protein
MGIFVRIDPNKGKKEVHLMVANQSINSTIIHHDETKNKYVGTAWVATMNQMCTEAVFLVVCDPSMNEL